MNYQMEGLSLAPSREGWMCSGYTVSSAREAPEWGRPVSGWICMPGAQVKEKGGMWMGEPSAQRQWMKVCDRWGCLESGPLF